MKSQNRIHGGHGILVRTAYRSQGMVDAKRGRSLVFSDRSCLGGHVGLGQHGRKHRHVARPDFPCCNAGAQRWLVADFLGQPKVCSKGVDGGRQQRPEEEVSIHSLRKP